MCIIIITVSSAVQRSFNPNFKLGYILSCNSITNNLLRGHWNVFLKS